MEAALQLGGFITFVVSITLLIMFIVLCVNVGTLVRLTRTQNEILAAIKRQGDAEKQKLAR